MLSTRWLQALAFLDIYSIFWPLSYRESQVEEVQATSAVYSYAAFRPKIASDSV
jgi:hypothetical protein